MTKFSILKTSIFGLSVLIFAISIVAWQRVTHSSLVKKAPGKFQLEPGLRIDLIAAEPLVVSPVALAFDENRQMYVIEDRGYPDPAEGGLPTKLGRVALLKDTNNDGTYDTRTEFVTGLTYPNGVMPWRGGIFVTCSPDIFYFKDTDGDGIADVKKVVLTGFFATQTAQIRMSHPILGLDGWVYVTAGLNGGNVTSPEHPERPAVSFTQADGRFNPDTFEFQVTGGQSQFGLTIDPYGRRFGTSNRHPIMHTVIEPWILRRNANLLFNETKHDVSEAEANAVVFPISKAVTTADFIPKLIGRSHAGTFTAASGLLFYKGTALTPAHEGNVFICESAQNLVQRQVVHPDGVTFKSELVYRGKEFLSSSDEWFRPVFLQHGPEGALYIADMHRKVIDHPSYVPEESRGLLDWESGKTDGRIYRVVREGFKDNEATNRARLNAASSVTQLVAALSSDEEWDRATAHRLLLGHKDNSSVPLLRKCVYESPRPEGRVRAIWMLRSLDSLDLDTEKKALSDKEPGVREQAILLAELMCKQYPELVTSLVSATDDASMRVRYHAAMVLGSVDTQAATQALAKIAVRDGADQWVRAAVLSGIEKRMPAFLSALRKQNNASPAAYAAVMQDLGRLYGTGASVADCRVLLQEVLAATANYEWRMSTLLGLAGGVSGRVHEFGTSPKGLLYAMQGPTATASLDSFISKVAILAGNKVEVPRVRMLATSLLGYTNYDRSHTALQKLLTPANPPELIRAAVSSLSHLEDARSAVLLTDKKVWPGYTPAIKAAVIGALISKPVFTNELFMAVEKGTIKVVEISSADRLRLMSDKNAVISDRAKVLFKELEGGNRMNVYQEYKKILSVNADPAKGKAIFVRTCSPCHTYLGQGGKVGPDLTGVKNQPAEALLLHIVVPNYEVLPAYQTVLIKTSDGRSFSGRILSETTNSLTIRTAFGTDESILRKNIVSLTNSGLSLMPDGLEQGMSKEDMAHLIAYLKAG